MNRTAATTVLTLALVLVLGASTVAARNVTRSEMISYDTLRDATGGDDLEHGFSEKPDRVRVTVQCKLKRGEFAWRVETPEGEVLWKNAIRAKAELELTEEFPGEAGEWRIVIDYKNASGRYHIKMEQVSTD